jgi:hypothetical protein
LILLQRRGSPSVPRLVSENQIVSIGYGNSRARLTLITRGKLRIDSEDAFSINAKLTISAGIETVADTSGSIIPISFEGSH